MSDRLLRASDLGGPDAGQEHAEWKMVVLDERTGKPAVLNGSVGHRYAGSDEGRWNLRLDRVEPALTLLDLAQGRAAIDLPRFDVGESEGGSSVRRGVPARRIGGKLVTTVLDLALAQYGVGREGLPGDWPAGYDDAEQPCTPAWQEQITGVDRHLAARVAREFARNAEVTEGRSMICMGAGTNHWFHSDQVYRTFLAPLGRRLFAGRHIADVNALGARLGWLPSYPSFDRSSLELAGASGSSHANRNRPSRSLVQHVLGGYAQLSFAFNYYGPTGSQRDEVTVLRKRESEVRFE